MRKINLPMAIIYSVLGFILMIPSQLIAQQINEGLGLVEDELLLFSITDLLVFIVVFHLYKCTYSIRLWIRRLNS